jgi:excisionase family DNA binding protein
MVIKGGAAMEQYLTVNQMCEWLMISRNTLSRWRKDGLPTIKIGRTIRFEKEEVKKWLRDQGKLI